MKIKAIVFTIFILATSLVLAQTAPLEPFEVWQKSRPNWAGDSGEVAYIAIRCSAIYGVIGTAFVESRGNEKTKNIGIDAQARGVKLLMFGAGLAETVGWSIEKSQERFQTNWDLYLKVVSSNQVTHNSVFHGFIQGDYKFCVDFERKVTAVANGAGRN